METRIGISGWRYAPWRGVFYPPGLPQKDELAYASRQLNSIEINGTFYSMQRPSSFRRWHDATPEGFRFAVKGPRYITHIRRLREVEAPLGNFYASGVLHLGKKLGPFLWQFPPSFRFERERMAPFFARLPRTVGEAARLARKADRAKPDLPLGTGGSEAPLRHAVEVRHASFENPDFVALLRKHGLALVFADTAGKWPYMEDLTADFLYLRLHGEEEIYRSGYDDVSLRWWARRIVLWRAGKEPKDAFTVSEKTLPPRPRDVHVYFDNDIKVRAPFDARRLAGFLGAVPQNHAAAAARSD